MTLKHTAYSYTKTENVCCKKSNGRDLRKFSWKTNEKSMCLRCTGKMSHIYNCEQLNQESEQKLEYENIFNGNIWDQIEV